MINGKKVVVVLPAYNASLTLEKTYREIPFDIVDEVVLCDDASKDNTSELARQIGIRHVITHVQNKGYGGNQKSLSKGTGYGGRHCHHAASRLPVHPKTHPAHGAYHR